MENPVPYCSTVTAFNWPDAVFFCDVEARAEHGGFAVARFKQDGGLKVVRFLTQDRDGNILLELWKYDPAKPKTYEQDVLKVTADEIEGPWPIIGVWHSPTTGFPEEWHDEPPANRV